MNEIRGVRKKNVIKIIQSLVKQGGCTKNELVFYTGLSLSTIDSLLEEMLKSNLVIKAGYRESTGGCLLYTSPSPRDRTRSRMPSSA